MGLEVAAVQWQLAAVANVAIVVSYVAIGVVIVRALLQTSQLRTNRLGLATAAIFFTAGLSHGVRALLLMLPSFGADGGTAVVREGYGWELVVVDALAALVGGWYLTQRSSYGQALQGPALFADLQERQRQALELNDTVLQGLVAAKYAFELEENARAEQLLDRSIEAVREIVTGLLGDGSGTDAVQPGDLVRSAPASLQDVAVGAGRDGRPSNVARS